MSEKISITFDDENRIRVLDADKYRETDLLRNESMEFIKSDIFWSLFVKVSLEIIGFDETITNLIETLENQANKIEQVKLRVY